ncbi:UNKNOWN [Stylonychia lemnae]|uniref:Uncharacterized protein n=1 Tax=Stylonychia lemnae TaxID=5949 RepID=A0A078A0V2_STYLE|nr:UNKNOWN [Stylonychia lemnae]|eukprot:CDW75492.1 UNKNOWN [Stylonychia lemnae]
MGSLSALGLAYATFGQEPWDLDFLVYNLDDIKKQLDSYTILQDAVSLGIYINTNNFDCQLLYQKSSENILNAFDSLYEMIKYQTIGYYPLLKDNFLQSCNNPELLTESASKHLLEIMLGQTNLLEKKVICKLPQIFYDNDLMGLYKGWRNPLMMTNGYTMQLATLGVSLSSACQILASNDYSKHQEVQDRFKDQMEQSFNSIIDMYTLALNQTMINAKNNIKIEMKNQFKKPLDQLGENIYSTLEEQFSNKMWMVTSYSSSGADIPITFNCTDCFNIYDSNQKQGVFVAAFDTNSQINPQLNNKDWNSELKKSKSISEFVSNSYKNNCIFGMIAIDPTASSYTAGPSDLAFVRSIDNEGTNLQKLKVWTVKDRCPHNEK